MIDNFLQVDYHSYDQVYRNPQTNTSIFIGDVQSALDHQFIKSCHIKTVVTAAKDMDHILYDSDTLHIVYPLLDGKNQDIATFFDSFYDLVQVNLSKGSILVHCAAGISRSSTLVISYIMKKQKMNFKDAISLIRKARPTVLPNLGFERQLKKYEQILKNCSKQYRNSRKNIKTSQSEKIQLLFKKQLLPALGVLGKFRLKDKMMSANVKHLVYKITEKDLQVLKIYNGRNESKIKKFIISKKCSSFSRPQQERELAIKSVQPESNFSRQSTKNMKRIKRKAKTPLQEMKEIYLSRKNGALLERRNPTDRGHTFYNLRAKNKIQM